MIPLSDASIEYPTETGRAVSPCETIVINRETVDSIKLDGTPASPAAIADAGAVSPPATEVAAA